MGESRWDVLQSRTTKIDYLQEFLVEEEEDDTDVFLDSSTSAKDQLANAKSSKGTLDSSTSAKDQLANAKSSKGTLDVIGLKASAIGLGVLGLIAIATLPIGLFIGGIVGGYKAYNSGKESNEQAVNKKSDENIQAVKSLKNPETLDEVKERPLLDGIKTVLLGSFILATTKWKEAEAIQIQNAKEKQQMKDYVPDAIGPKYTGL